MDAIHRDVHAVILPAASKRPGFPVLILKFQLHQQITGILVVQVVELRAGVEAHAGDGEGDGVCNTALSHTHVAGNEVHAAKLESLAVCVALKAADGKALHAELFDRLDH